MLAASLALISPVMIPPAPTFKLVSCPLSSQLWAEYIVPGWSDSKERLAPALLLTVPSESNPAVAVNFAPSPNDKEDWVKRLS